MPNTTTNYSLEKPLATEFYDVEVQNRNMDKVDIELKNTNGKLTTHETKYNNPHKVTSEQVNKIEVQTTGTLPAYYPVGISLFSLTAASAEPWKTAIGHVGVNDVAIVRTEKMTSEYVIVQRIVFHANSTSEKITGVYERSSTANNSWSGPWVKVILREEFDLFQDEVNAHLAENAKRIKPYSYIDYGMAFDSNDETLPVRDVHASWAHGNVAYDEADDKVVVFYNVKPGHVLTDNRVLMRKKDIEGGFSTPIVVANRISDGISCKSQSSGIAKNGDYISMVAHLNNSNATMIGTWLYRSLDKGVTWNATELRINGQPLLAFNGDVTGFLVLKSGRILVLVKQSSTASTLIYSDDNGLTWNYINQDFGGNTEPAWCELSDGTIICYMRDNVDNRYDEKIPARFTKSNDGGMTWTSPINSTSILDFTNSNGHLIFHEDSKTVEFIHHSRFQLADGYSSLYVAIATEENAKQDDLGEQIRISRLAPHYKPVNNSLGDCGYVGACKSKTGVITVTYYNGTYDNAQICYMEGYKSLPYRQPKHIDQNTGREIKNESEDFIFGIVPTLSKYYEQGTINLNVGSTDTLLESSTRIRLKDFVRIKPSTRYKIITLLSNYKMSIREYDENFINLSDSGWRTSYTFNTLPNTKYIKIIVKKSDDSVILPSDIETNTFNIYESPFESKLTIYDNGNEKEYHTGLYQQILTNGTGAYAKNDNNLQLSLTNDNTVGDVGGTACYITQNSIDATSFTKIKANVIVSGVTGSSGASLRLYNKANPANGADGRIGFTEIKVDGRHTLSIDVDNATSLVYPAVSVSKLVDGVAGSITAKFYEIWLE